MLQILLQNAPYFLLQNATVITKRDDFITKYDSYCKMRRYIILLRFHLMMLTSIDLKYYDNNDFKNSSGTTFQTLLCY